MKLTAVEDTLCEKGFLISEKNPVVQPNISSPTYILPYLGPFGHTGCF